MEITDGPSKVAHWEHFRSYIVAAHPEWEVFIVGEKIARRNLPDGEPYFFVEIPSIHPTIREPLTVEIADRIPGANIDVYWGRYFEHVGHDRKSPVEEQFDRVISAIEDWQDDSRVFSFWYNLATGRRTRWGRLDFPLTDEKRSQADSYGERIEFFSWSGNRDGRYPE